LWIADALAALLPWTRSPRKRKARFAACTSALPFLRILGGPTNLLLQMKLADP
jgi:hypothetical protein